IAPRSGYYVERQATSDREGVRIDVPNDLPFSPGKTLDVNFGPERGMPFLSKLTFYGAGIPSGALGLGLGIAYVAADDPTHRAFYMTGAIMYTSFAAATLWWFLYSDEKHFRFEVPPASRQAGARLGPGFVFGTF